MRGRGVASFAIRFHEREQTQVIEVADIAGDYNHAMTSKPTGDAIAADPRLERLTEWLRTTLHQPRLTVEVASADASFRRYFRARDGEQTWIAMDAPPDKENVGPFIAVAEMLTAAGVNAPRILARNLDAGFLLLSDLGNRTYLAELAVRERAEPLYQAALAALAQMQAGCAAHVAALPPYDAALLRREMELFPEWFLQRHLGIEVDAAMRRTLDAAFELLIESALAQPRVFVHRDYHSRNLMSTVGEPRFGPNPGVLDFQDAVFGPITYDLVSLLRDCYIAWPQERVAAWALQFRQQAQTAGLMSPVDPAQWMQWFDLMGVQRHLKAIGIFARLWHRDGKRGYLDDIPRTLGYIRAVLPQYPAFKDFSELIDLRIVAALASKRQAS
jgi:aminoglycoside/choline kinase family phosphotransferase